MKIARDEVREALGEEDPSTALQRVAIELAGKGFGRKGVDETFVEVVEELVEEGREEDATLVSRILDMVSEW